MSGKELNNGVLVKFLENYRKHEVLKDNPRQAQRLLQSIPSQEECRQKIIALVDGVELDALKSFRDKNVKYLGQVFKSAAESLLSGDSAVTDETIEKLKFYLGYCRAKDNRFSLSAEGVEKLNNIVLSLIEQDDVEKMLGFVVVLNGGKKEREFAILQGYKSKLLVFNQTVIVAFEGLLAKFLDEEKLAEILQILSLSGMELKKINPELIDKILSVCFQKCPEEEALQLLEKLDNYFRCHQERDSKDKYYQGVFKLLKQLIRAKNVGGFEQVWGLIVSNDSWNRYNPFSDKQKQDLLFEAVCQNDEELLQTVINSGLKAVDAVVERKDKDDNLLYKASLLYYAQSKNFENSVTVLLQNGAKLVSCFDVVGSHYDVFLSHASEVIARLNDHVGGSKQLIPWEVKYSELSQEPTEQEGWGYRLKSEGQVLTLVGNSTVTGFNENVLNWLVEFLESSSLLNTKMMVSKIAFQQSTKDEYDSVDEMVDVSAFAGCMQNTKIHNLVFESCWLTDVQGEQIADNLSDTVKSLTFFGEQRFATSKPFLTLASKRSAENKLSLDLGVIAIENDEVGQWFELARSNKVSFIRYQYRDALLGGFYVSFSKRSGFEASISRVDGESGSFDATVKGDRDKVEITGKQYTLAVSISLFEHLLFLAGLFSWKSSFAFKINNLNLSKVDLETVRFGDWLKARSSIYSLAMTKCRMGNDQARGIAKEVLGKEGVKIHALDLSDNLISGCSALVESIKQSRSLAKLNMSGNRFGDQAIDAIIAGVNHNKSLVEVGIVGGLKDLEVKKVLNIPGKRHHLRSVCFDNYRLQSLELMSNPSKLSYEKAAEFNKRKISYELMLDFGRVSSSAFTQVISAIQSGDFDSFKSLVNSSGKVSIHARDDHGTGFLHEVVTADKPDFLKYLLLETACDPRVRNRSGLTAEAIAQQDPVKYKHCLELFELYRQGRLKNNKRSRKEDTPAQVEDDADQRAGKVARVETRPPQSTSLATAIIQQKTHYQLLKILLREQPEVLFPGYLELCCQALDSGQEDCLLLLLSQPGVDLQKIREQIEKDADRAREMSSNVLLQKVRERSEYKALSNKVGIQWAESLDCFFGFGCKETKVPGDSVHAKLKQISMQDDSKAAKDGNTVYYAFTFVVALPGEQRTAIELILSDIGWEGKAHISEIYEDEESELQAVKHRTAVARSVGFKEGADERQIQDLFNQAKHVGYHQAFHHSEQSLYSLMESSIKVEALVAGLSKKLEEKFPGKNISGYKVYGVVLDIYSKPNYMCVNCEAGAIGVQNSHEEGFLFLLKNELTKKGLRFSKNSPIKMLTRVTATDPCKGRDVVLKSHHSKFYVDMKSTGNRVILSKNVSVGSAHSSKPR